MASRLTTYVWDHYPEGGGELLTALAAAEHGDPNGDNIYPSIKTLCAMTQQSDRTVQRHLLNMESNGWLVVTSRGGGRGKYTKYRMPIELIPQDVRGTVTKLRCLGEPRQKGDKTPTTDALKGDKTPTTGTLPIGVPVPTTTNTSESFEKFWTAYPRKTAITTARVAFGRVNPDATLLATMLASIEAHKRTEQWKRDVIPHAATWLNQKRWQDELKPTAKPIDRSCVEHVGQGQKCGMPGELHGSDYVCDGHWHKRIEKREMPASARDALANLRKPTAVMS